MSLPPKTKDFTPLTGIDEISVPSNAVLKFSYPNLAEPLYIHSGANSIKWSFILNTKSTPTIGGEVIQVLSATVGPITISGQTAGLRTNQSGQLGPNQTRGWKDSNGKEAFTPNHELQAIVAWFRKYMTIAGTDQGGIDPRNRAIIFTYAERGWTFAIQPTALKGFRYDKAVISPEWSITAEVVSNNGLDFFSGVTMSSFTDELLTTNTKLQGQIGLSNFARTSTEKANPNFGQTGDFGSTNPFLNPSLSGDASLALQKMGDNFQGLVAAWSQGDFAHFGFGAMLDNNALPKDVNAVYEKLFGSTLLGSLPGSSQSNSGGGGSGSYTYSGSNQQDQVAVQVANAFESKGVPAVLGVAVALHESALNPDCVQGSNGNAVTNGGVVQGDGAIGLFQTFAHSLLNGGAGAGGGLPHASEIDAAMKPLTLGQPVPKGYSVLKYYPTAHQVDDGASWFKADKPGGLGGDVSSLSDDQLAQWAYAAQRGSGYVNGSACTSLFKTDLEKARSILKILSTVPGAKGTLVQIARSQLGVGEVPSGSNSGPQVNNYLASVGLGPGNAWCAAFAYWVYQSVFGNKNPLTKTGLVLTQYEFAKSKGWTVPISQAQPGDLAIFNWSGRITTDPSQYHIGIVTQILNGEPQMISGNYGDKVSPEGPQDLVAIISPPIPADKRG